jgi:hypothetical protein
MHNRLLDYQDQQDAVSYFSRLAITACSLTLQIGKGPKTALEVLEQGRVVILGLLMDNRSDTSELRAVHPQLCAQYEDLRLEVNKPVKNITDYCIRKTSSLSRIEAIAKLEKYVQDIQQLPGFG